MRSAGPPEIGALLAAAEAEFAEEIERADRMPSLTATSLLSFLEIPTGSSFDVPPERAIGYFRAKGLRPTFHYADMLDAAHDQAFTVAKMMDVDMLAQVRASLDSALANGVTFAEWSKTITPVLQSGGWWGKRDMLDPLSGQPVRAQLGSAWRLETIFRTNMQSAYAAGQWAEIAEQADIAPYLMYDAIDDFRTRPLHRSWDGTVLPVNSPWWKTHFPPNGWNCRCGTIQLSYAELAGMGLRPAVEPPQDGTYRWRNPRTDVQESIPAGLDPGFAHNPGLSLQLDLNSLLSEKVAALPQGMKEAAQKGVEALPLRSPAGRAGAAIAKIADATKTGPQLVKIMSPLMAGYVEARIAGTIPTQEQINAYDALPARLQREVDAAIAENKNAPEGA